MEAARAQRDERGDVGTVALETTKLGIETVAEGLATGIIEVGTATPLVAPLFIALKKAKEAVDKAVRREEELKDLHALCGIITGQVIDKCRANSSSIDVSPLRKCIEDLKALAELCSHKSTFRRKLRSLKHGDSIQNLRERINHLVPVMGLAAAVDISAIVEDVRRNMVSAAKRMYAVGRRLDSKQHIF